MGESVIPTLVYFLLVRIRLRKRSIGWRPFQLTDFFCSQKSALQPRTSAYDLNRWANERLP